MGLKEQRAIEIVRTRDLPACEAEIERYIGVRLPVEVDWSALDTSGEDAVFSVNGMALRRVASAMLTASHDATVKTAFATSLKGFRIVPVTDSELKAVSLDTGTVVIAVNFADSYDGGPSDQDIYNTLLDAL